ncbi:sensor histidine kinase [Kitasatospora sp. NPDC048365]|uniref:sensor histidine kinase n=1 Tax=Kitasatospora sp. NPDC048365 TaxID=3364050 RepID=UPI003711F6B2
MWGFRLRNTRVPVLTALAERWREAGRLEERERIAREVHDTIAQELAGIAMLARAADGALTGEGAGHEVARERLRTLHRTTVLALGHAQDLTAGAAVSELAEGGLVPALEQYVELCRRHMVAARQLLDMGPGVGWLSEPRVPEIRLRVSGARRRLPLPVESVVLWSMREGISNAIRHAAAERVTVDLDHLPDRLRASVRDDGVGLAAGRGGSGGSGIGLDGLRRRVVGLGGRMVVEGGAGGGTTLRVEFEYSTRGPRKTSRRFV